VTFDACGLGDHELTRGWADPGLRDYQAAALSAWTLAGHRGLIVLPTGSGKTRIAIAAMSATRLPALCLVPTRVLLEQWRQEVLTIPPAGGLPPRGETRGSLSRDGGSHPAGRPAPAL
jgi:superfamily II DNA or RNA helicase